MASGGIRYRDRASGRIVEERVFGERTLRFVYAPTLRARLARALLRRPLASHLYGWRQRRATAVAAFAREVGIDPEEAAKPLSEYATVDEFFARRLKPGARPVDASAEHLVSPADARVLVFPRLEGAFLPVKGASVPLEELLRDRVAAARFAGGSAAVLRLAVADYHRFHFPDSGVAGPARAISGPLDSVHPIALAAGAPSFENKRVVTELDSDRFGKLVLTAVGALCVGTIELTYRPGRVERGAEMGTFRFGGSTVVLVAEKHALVWDDDLVAATREGLETLVRMGTRIARSARTSG